MASIYLRGNTWQIQYRDAKGKPKQESLKTTDEDEARRMLRQVETEIARHRLAVRESEATLADLAAAYRVHAHEYYRKPDGTPTSQQHLVETAVRALESLGDIRIPEFGPLKLREMRDRWIGAGLARKTINSYVGAVRAIFRWGISYELVPETIHAALVAVPSLRAGRSAARETEKTRPVPDAHVEAVRAKVPRQIRALIDLQWYTGARGGELFELRPCDINRQGSIWTAKPHHKNEWRGQDRTLYFGPRSQRVLQPFLFDRGPADYLFSPRDAITEKAAEAEAHRRPNQRANPRKTARRVGPHYTRDSYRRAITRACEAADVDRWTPHQLRHSAGTRIRAEFSAETAQAVLGHKTLEATQIYAEINEARAIKVAQEMG